MTASSGLIQSIIASTPMIVQTAVMSWVRVCCSELAMLSMSLVTRLRMSPRGWLVVVAQRQARELRVDVPSHPVDGPLRDAGHDVGLHPGEERAQDVDDRHDDEHVAQGRQVDARARGDGHGREHVGLLGLAGGVQRVDRLLLGHPRRDLLADDALEQDVGGVAEELRADDREGHADDGEQDDEDDPRRLGSERARQPTERALEVLGLLGRQAGPAERATTTEAAAGRWPTRATGPASGAAGPAHAASSWLSCE